MENYIIVENNIVVGFGLKAVFNSVMLLQNQKVYFTDGTFLIGDKVYNSESDSHMKINEVGL